MLRKLISRAALTLAGAALLAMTGCGDTTNTTTKLQTDQELAGDSSGIPKAIPSISATTPFNGQTNVATNETISVTFNTNINFSTLLGNFIVQNQGNAPVAGTFAANGTTVTFIPNVPLTPNTQYRVKLSRDLKSSTNGSMVKDLDFFFFTNTNVTPLQLAYHYITDNNEIGGDATFTWDDISATGTNSGVAGDDNSGAIPIGFNFNFYGTNYNTAFVGTNGYLTFGAADATWTNYPFPSNDANPRIAPWFDDLSIDGPGKIVYQVRGVAPSRRLIVQWNQVRNTFGGPRGDFEVILYEGSNEVIFQYLNTNITGANGISATVGLNKGDGVQDTLYSFNRAYLANGRIVRFVPIGGTALIPPNGSTGVNRNGILYAFFNKPLNGATINSPATTFRLAETLTNATVPSLSNVFTGFSNAIVFNLGGTLNANTNYTATISTALTDIYGIHLVTPVTWSFTTGP